MIHANETDVSCSKCRNRYYRSCSKTDCNIQESTYVPPEQKSRPSLSSPKSISLPLQAVRGPSHSSCCFCKKRGHKFVVVPSHIRNSIFMEKNIIIRAGSRCCPGHIVDDSLRDDTLTHLSDLKSECSFNRTDILNLLEQIREIALKSQNKRIDFDLDSFMSDADYRNLMGLSKLSFHDLCSHVSEIRNSKNRSLRTCIGIYLTKLRSGMSNRLLSTIFNIGMDAIKQ